MLKDKILNKESGIITYGLTPPKQNNEHEKLLEISQKQIERINSIDIDALVIYDIQDESDRTKEDRTFPFLSTVDPAVYADEYLAPIHLPKIIYRCVGKYTQEQLSAWINLFHEGTLSESRSRKAPTLRTFFVQFGRAASIPFRKRSRPQTTGTILKAFAQIHIFQPTGAT
jgi:hypothetical protein